MRSGATTDGWSLRLDMCISDVDVLMEGDACYCHLSPAIMAYLTVLSATKAYGADFLSLCENLARR